MEMNILGRRRDTWGYFENMLFYALQTANLFHHGKGLSITALAINAMHGTKLDWPQ